MTAQTLVVVLAVTSGMMSGRGRGCEWAVDAKDVDGRGGEALHHAYDGQRGQTDQDHSSRSEFLRLLVEGSAVCQSI